MPFSVSPGILRYSGPLCLQFFPLCLMSSHYAFSYALYLATMPSATYALYLATVPSAMPYILPLCLQLCLMSCHCAFSYALCLATMPSAMPYIFPLCLQLCLISCHCAFSYALYLATVPWLLHQEPSQKTLHDNYYGLASLAPMPLINPGENPVTAIV